jgi:RND family efflux transporter MFP subunit
MNLPSKLFSSSLVLGLLLSLWSGTALAQNNQLWTAQSQLRPAYLQYAGVIEAVAKSTVSAQTSGRIAELPFDVNDLVPQGAVIVRFVDTEQQARLQQAVASLQEAESRATEAANELKRAKDLYQRQLVAKAQLDAAVANDKAATARKQQAKAALAEAKEQQEQTLVRAPFTGIVTARHVEVGELATPGKALMSGLSLQHLRVLFAVPQQQIAALRQQQKAEVLVDNQQWQSGEKLTVFPYADAQSHSFQVRMELAAGTATLYPGSRVKVRVLQQESSVIAIPASAVVQRGEQSLVLRKIGEQQLLQAVVLGQRYDDDMVEVLSGVAAGDQLVLTNH